MIPAAAEAGKVGWVFILDRRTGKLIRKSDPYVMMSKNMFSTPTPQGRHAARREWRRGVVAACVFASDAPSIHPGDGPVDALHDEACEERAGSHSARERIHRTSPTARSRMARSSPSMSRQARSPGSTRLRSR